VREKAENRANRWVKVFIYFVDRAVGYGFGMIILSLGFT
jgi:hypothetical protein